MNGRERRALKRMIFCAALEAGPEDVLRHFVPRLLPYRHLLDGDPMLQILDRWDPVSETILDCPICGAELLGHVSTCPFGVEPDPDLDNFRP